MKVIVISDIHGNLEALNKVLEYINKLEGETACSLPWRYCGLRPKSGRVF